MDSYQLGIGSSNRQPLTFGINHIFSHHEFKRARIDPSPESKQPSNGENNTSKENLKNKTDEASQSISKESTAKETISTTPQTPEPTNSQSDNETSPPQGQGNGHGHEQEHPTKPTNPGRGPPTSPGKSNEVHPKHDVPEQPNSPKQEHDNPKSKDSETGESSEVRIGDGTGRTGSGPLSTDHKPSPESGHGSSSTTAEHE